jgi:succinate dehydrogenase flavin-adding protein (antitoxin of CptAB toxin-antitoxin module)
MRGTFEEDTMLGPFLRQKAAEYADIKRNILEN